MRGHACRFHLHVAWYVYVANIMRKYICSTGTNTALRERLSDRREREREVEGWRERERREREKEREEEKERETEKQREVLSANNL
jgi:hypothetical protein